MLYKGPVVRFLPALAWMSQNYVVRATPLVVRQSQLPPDFIGIDAGEDTTIQCSAVSSPNANPAALWTTALADGAFANATSAFLNQPPEIPLPGRLSGQQDNLPFDEAVAHFCNGPANYDCKLGSTVCSAGVANCQSVASPACWMILSSMTNFRNYFQNLFDGISNAQSDVQGQMISFTNLFAPPIVKDNNKLAELLIEIFTTVVAVALSFVSAGAGLGLLGVTGTVAGIDAAKLTDKAASVVNTIAGQAFSLTKQNLPAAQQAIENQGALGDKLVATVDQMQSILSTIVNGYANFPAPGDVNNASTPQGLFTGGTWLRAPLGSDAFDYKQQFKNILFGSLINQTFSLSPNLHPALVLETKDCSDHSHDPFPALQTARSCAIPGKVAWLVSLDFNSGKVGFQPGVASDQLKGDPQIWGGIVFDDIVKSIYDGWTANGSPASGLYGIDPLNNIADGSGNKSPIPWVGGTKTPGFFQLPVCTLDVFSKNINRAVTTQAGRPNSIWAGYPCGSPP